ncbi:MAG: hypothetical protein AAF902_26155 [Chloroflexota bacterium]
MNLDSGNVQISCRPILGCIVLIFFCGMFSILTLPLGFGASVFAGEFGQMGAIRNDIADKVEANPQIIDAFGTPMEIRMLGSNTSFSLEGNVRSGSYEAPIGGPLGSGTIFAEYEKVGEEISYSELIVVTSDERVIDILSN